jgi:hypothetical protein
MAAAVLALWVIPAKAGIHFSAARAIARCIPACAGMTDWTQQGPTKIAIIEWYVAVNSVDGGRELGLAA